VYTTAPPFSLHLVGLVLRRMVDSLGPRNSAILGRTARANHRTFAAAGPTLPTAGSAAGLRSADHVVAVTERARDLLTAKLDAGDLHPGRS